MTFFLISVDCVTLLKRLSQLAFSDRIKHPDINENALWLLTPKPFPQISKQASPHNLIKDCSTSASLQMSDKNVDVVSLTEEILNGKLHFLCSVRYCWSKHISVKGQYVV